MKSDAPPIGSDATPELVFERLFNAPAKSVFRAWTDPTRLVQWWGPHGFRTTIERMDVRVGGTWSYILHGPDGVQYPNTAVFEILEPPHRLVFRNTGGHIQDKHLTCRMVATFVEKQQQTQVKLRMQFQSIDRLASAKQRGAVEGGEQSLERLAALLPGSECRNL
ncbi:SRPBCC domain-containing protein [Cognatiyoonia sp. IB215182]|uniref:SRPBCC domain-containing protein n=1 Tax=Cognatiyoonia sp. IB215182 TaxID=3097353 RepID=UPI002A11F7BB|nr:SRPBCC domain-containing protein [Cognatiyoonia sp. IB215182]MDX8355812.1 SRPBCC domain-containing protein [Cognatiyoonia sp. IB215182]